MECTGVKIDVMSKSGGRFNGLAWNLVLKKTDGRRTTNASVMQPFFCYLHSPHMMHPCRTDLPYVYESIYTTTGVFSLNIQCLYRMVGDIAFIGVVWRTKVFDGISALFHGIEVQELPTTLTITMPIPKVRMMM